MELRLMLMLPPPMPAVLMPNNQATLRHMAVSARQYSTYSTILRLGSGGSRSWACVRNKVVVVVPLLSVVVVVVIVVVAAVVVVAVSSYWKPFRVRPRSEWIEGNEEAGKRKTGKHSLHQQNELIEQQKKTAETTLEQLKDIQKQLIQSEKMAGKENFARLDTSYLPQK
jgi:hypothetical protein